MLNEYIGPRFANLAAKSSTLAKDLKANEKSFRTQYPDYDGPILGGLRVLFMMACGPAITKENHMMRVTNLVEECVLIFSWIFTIVKLYGLDLICSTWSSGSVVKERCQNTS